MNKWYIGQEIVVIKGHSQNIFKEGDIFVIKGLRNGFCCSKVQIDIGFNKTANYQTCSTCYNHHWFNDTNALWFDEKRFVPLDSFVNHEELNEIKQNLNLEPIWKN